MPYWVFFCTRDSTGAKEGIRWHFSGTQLQEAQERELPLNLSMDHPTKHTQHTRESH